MKTRAAFLGLIGLGIAAMSPPASPAPARGLGAHPEGPPPGHTGGFGEPTCQVCHTEYALNAPGGRRSIEGVPTGWEGGRSYTLTVVLHSEEMGAAGFQLSARTPEGRPAGRFRTLDDRVAIDSVASPDGGWTAYARQTRAGSTVSDPALTSWTLQWTAQEGLSDVAFHAAANSANGDNSPFGDLVYVTSLTGRRAPTPR